MNFKIGDKVRVYGTDRNGNLVSGVDIITGFSKEGHPYFQENSPSLYTKDYDLTLPHPKQCRKLKKKEPRHFWILKDNIKEQNLDAKPDLKWLHKFIEVVEVKK